ncbi:MAG: mechanosensitive ion channel [Nitrospira sp.]|nr:mechanosensitive ion channel [Nitrospira sp.]
MTISGTTITVGGLLVAALIAGATLLLANRLSDWIRRLLRARQVAVGAQYSISTIVQYTTYLLGLLTAFNALGIHLSALLAASAVLAVGVGFGLQTITQNVICGVILLVDESVRVGDYIKVGDSLGTVVDIGLRATRIVTRDEMLIIVPNSTLITTEIVNQSRPNTRLRIDVSADLAYDSDVDQVMQTLIAVACGHGEVLKDPVPEIRLNDFGTSALNVSLLCWIDQPSEQQRIRSELRIAIAKTFTGEARRTVSSPRPVYPFSS